MRGKHDKFSLNRKGLQVIAPTNNKNLMLIHFPLDKMAAILADGIFKCIFLT